MLVGIFTARRVDGQGPERNITVCAGRDERLAMCTTHVKTLCEARREIIASGQKPPMSRTESSTVLVQPERGIRADHTDNEPCSVCFFCRHLPSGEIHDAEIGHGVLGGADRFAYDTHAEDRHRLQLPDKELLKASAAEEILSIWRPLQILDASVVLSESPNATESSLAVTVDFVTADLDVCVFRSGCENGRVRRVSVGKAWSYRDGFDFSSMSATVTDHGGDSVLRRQVKLRGLDPGKDTALTYAIKLP